MKNTMKLFLAVVIFCSAGLAGDQGNGGYQCPPEGCPPPCEVNCTNTLTEADNTDIDLSDIIENIVREGFRLRF